VHLSAPGRDVPGPPRRDRPAVARDDRVVREPPAQLPGQDLRLHRRVAARAALIHELAPLRHALLRGLEEAPVAFRTEQGQERRQRPAAIAHEPDLDRIAQADPPRVQFDLDAARLPGLRQELDVREGGSDDQQRVALLQRLLRRARAEQADGARRERAVVGHRALAEQRLRDRRGEAVGRLLEEIAGADRAAPGEDRHLAPGVEHVRRPAQGVLGGAVTRSTVDVGRVAGDVARRAAPVHLHLLDVRGNGDVGDAAIRERGAARQVRNVLHRLRLSLFHQREGVVRRLLRCARRNTKTFRSLRGRRDRVDAKRPGKPFRRRRTGESAAADTAGRASMRRGEPT